MIAWLLIVPPKVPGTAQVNPSAPRSEWTVRRKFPHQEGCLAARDRLRTIGENNIATRPRGAAGGGELRWCVECAAECVSADDPGMTGK